MHMGRVACYYLTQRLIRIPQRYLWISDNTILSQQRGIFRVNCIDCLDRTNVVQVGTFQWSDLFLTNSYCSQRLPGTS